MKLWKPVLLIVLFALPFCAIAQKDSIRLACPLNEAIVVPPPKNAIRYDPPDLCIVLMSKPDSTVKACINARVTNIETDDEGKFGVVLFAKHNGSDYYFWYTGLNKTVVKRNQVVKVGEPIGYLTPGEKIEMLMYNFETPVDPTKYLDCTGVLKGF